MIGYSWIFNIIAIYAPKVRNTTYSYNSFTLTLSPVCVPILIHSFYKYYYFYCIDIMAGLIGLTLADTLGKKRINIIPEEEEEKKIKE